MKKRRSGSFLTRCVTLTVLLALLSVLLASTACYYSMLKEEQRQEDASMHIAAATARQRMDDFLARYQLLLDQIMINRSYSRLYADGSSSSDEQALENIAVNENVQYLFHAPANAANSAALWKLQQESGFVPPEYGNLTLYGLDGTLRASTIYNAESLRTKPSYHTFTWDNMLHQRQLWQYRQGEWGSIRLGILVAGASRELPGHGEKLGTIWMDFDDTGLKSIMNDLITETSRCALYDRDGKLLLWTDGFEAPDTLNDLPDSSLYFCIEDETLPTNGWAVRLFVSNGAFSSRMKRVWLLTGALLLSSACSGGDGGKPTWQGGQGGNFLFGCGGGIGEADNRLHAWRTQALGDQLRQSCGGGTAIGSAHHGAQNIPSECIGTALVVDQMSPAAAAGFAAIGRAGVTDGTGACNQHSAHRLAQGTGQRRDLVANDLQRAGVAACADDILNKGVSIRVADTCAADAKPIAPGQPFRLGS